MIRARLGVVLLCLAPPLAGQSQFIGQQINPPDVVAQPAVIEDFDGDGELDVVYGAFTESGGSMLRFQPGDGFGWFGTAQQLALGPAFAGVDAALDVDLDGDVDLVSRLDGPSLGVILNDGAAHFTAGGVFALGHESEGPLEVADLDGDGHTDVLAMHSSAALASIALGDGAGGFGAPSVLLTELQVAQFALGDITEDGAPDIVLPHPGDTQLRVFPGDGAGGFLPAYPVPTGTETSCVAIGDFTGDGRPDLAAGRYFAGPGQVLMLKNFGVGFFAAPLTFDIYDKILDVKLTDMNQDGRNDIVVLMPNVAGPGLAVIRSMHDGTVFALTASQTTGYNPQGLRTADLDGDGLPDVVCEASGGLDVFRGVGQCQLVSPTQLIPSQISVQFLFVADLSGDGHADILAACGAGVPFADEAVTLYEGDGAGNFGAPIELPAGNGPDSLAAADFDGNGQLEIVVAHAFSHDLSLFREQGSSWTSVMPDGWPWYAFNLEPASVQTADFDGDGQPDILAALAKIHEVSVVRSLPGGSFAPPSTLYLDGVGIAQAVSGDFDDDGDLDAAIAGGSTFGSVGVLLNDGSGQLSIGPPAVDTPLNSNHPIVADDFDLDGHLDVATGAWNVFLGDGTGALVPTLPSPSLFGASTLASADVDGDGLPDVVGTEGSGRVAVMRGDGAGGLAGGLAVAAPTFPSGASACADVDGDLHPDLVAGGGFGQLISVHLNQRQAFAWTSLGAALAGGYGTPSLEGQGALTAGSAVTLRVDAAPPGAPLTLVVGLTLLAAPFKGGLLLPNPDLLIVGPVLDADGFLELGGSWPAALPSGLAVHFQGWIADAGGPKGLSATNGLTATTP